MLYKNVIIKNVGDSYSNPSLTSRQLSHLTWSLGIFAACKCLLKPTTFFTLSLLITKPLFSFSLTVFNLNRRLQLHCVCSDHHIIIFAESNLFKLTISHDQSYITASVLICIVMFAIACAKIATYRITGKILSRNHVSTGKLQLHRNHEQLNYMKS